MVVGWIKEEHAVSRHVMQGRAGGTGGGGGGGVGGGERVGGTGMQGVARWKIRVYRVDRGGRERER